MTTPCTCHSWLKARSMHMLCFVFEEMLVDWVGRRAFQSLEKSSTLLAESLLRAFTVIHASSTARSSATYGLAFLIHKCSFMERGRLWSKRKPLPRTQQASTEFWSKTVFRKRLGFDFQIAMNGATDPTNPPNPLLYSFRLFWAKIRKIQKYIEILYFPLVGSILPYLGNCWL